MTAVTNSQDNKDDVTKEDINAGMNAVANFIFLHNVKLKEWSYLLGVTLKTEGMLVQESYT